VLSQSGRWSSKTTSKEHETQCLRPCTVFFKQRARRTNERTNEPASYATCVLLAPVENGLLRVCDGGRELCSNRVVGAWLALVGFESVECHPLGEDPLRKTNGLSELFSLLSIGGISRCLWRKEGRRGKSAPDCRPRIRWYRIIVTRWRVLKLESHGLGHGCETER